MLVAIAGVVLAVAGSATAASVITGKQIKNSSITSQDIKNKSLLRGDFRSGQLPAGARGPQGPQGLRGPQGAAGARGTNGFGQLRYIEEAFPFANGEADFVTALCPAGTFPTGGGAWAADSATLLVDHPEVITSQGVTFTDAGIGNGYFATVSNVASGAVDVVVDVICANASQTLPNKNRHRRAAH
ncbi:MAG: collagen-like protein [Thermoleophilaceae bacterium]|nr:collagen-like protein [Thermoleophilaceae bacterium]